ncbi:MAG: T9SS type A sorting domain-containing protein, partial [Lewinella sp.]
PFDLNGAGPGTCDIWYLSAYGDVTGVAMGSNIADIAGCFDLSNAITVIRNEADAGAIALEDGATEVTICAGDGTGDPLTVVMSGDVAGDNSTFLITDAATGEILGVPGNNGPFDLDGAGPGICEIWYLSSYGDVMGVAMGSNIDDIVGCFDLSNPITVTRLAGDDCNGGFTFDNVVINEVTVDGRIEFFNGTDEAVDVSSFWLCNFPAYQQISTMTLECGEFLIQPGEVTVISGFNGFNAVDAELGLYTTNSFGTASALIAYLEWGSTGHRRSSLAVNNGFWSNGQVADAPTGNQSTQLTINDNDELVWNLADLSVCSLNNLTNTGGSSTEARVSIFPNPVSGDMLNVTLEGMRGEMMQLQIFDMNGRQLQLQTMEMVNGPTGIQLPASPAGTYFLRVVNSGRVVTERFTRF